MSCPFSSGTTTFPRYYDPNHVYVLGTFLLKKGEWEMVENAARQCCETSQEQADCIFYNFHVEHLESPLKHETSTKNKDEFVTIGMNQEWKSLQSLKNHLKTKSSIQFWQIFDQLRQKNLIINDCVQCFGQAKFNTFKHPAMKQSQTHNPASNHKESALAKMTALLPKCPFTRTMMLVVPSIFLFGYISSRFEIKVTQKS